MLTTDQKGAIAEAAIVQAAIRLGITVWRPVLRERYDLVSDLGKRFLRVQCKWAAREDEIVVVRSYSCRRTRDGLIRRRYSSDEIDAVAAYCGELDRCYLLPRNVFSGRAIIHLRLGPTRNTQSRGIRWAEEYEFAATLSRQQGAIAQLGERLAGSQKVTGSNPVGSTSS
jgi:hypothetical protein